MRPGLAEKLILFGALGAVCIVPLAGVVLRATGVVTRTPPDGEASVAPPHDLRAPLVTIYRARECAACDESRAWFDARSLPVRERDVDDDPEARTAASRMSPSGKLPAVAIGDEVVVGYEPASFESSLTRAIARRRFR